MKRQPRGAPRITILLPSPALAQVKQVYWAPALLRALPITDLIPSVPKEKAREVTIP